MGKSSIKNEYFYFQDINESRSERQNESTENVKKRERRNSTPKIHQAMLIFGTLVLLFRCSCFGSLDQLDINHGQIW